MKQSHIEWLMYTALVVLIALSMLINIESVLLITSFSILFNSPFLFSSDSLKERNKKQGDEKKLRTLRFNAFSIALGAFVFVVTAPFKSNELIKFIDEHADGSGYNIFWGVEFVLLIMGIHSTVIFSSIRKKIALQNRLSNFK